MSIIKDLNRFNSQALAVAGTETHWVYNYRLRQRFSIFGIPFWKVIHFHTFFFPRYSNSPKADGLRDYMLEQSNRYYV